MRKPYRRKNSNDQFKPSVDTNRPLKQTILAEDIEGSDPRSESNCAGARALRRRRGVINASVGAEVVILEYRTHFVRYFLSPNDRKVVRTFDVTGVFVEGYTFHLVPPPQGRKLGDRRGERQGSNKRTPGGNNVYKQCYRHVKKPHAPMIKKPHAPMTAVIATPAPSQKVA